MRAVVCRVDHAAVEVDGPTVGRIGPGLLVYAGIMQGDAEQDLQWMARKLTALRLFNDEQGKMNLCVRDIGGSILLIPNFTLAGRTDKGTRPSYCDAQTPALAKPMFEALAAECGKVIPIATGIFGAHMLIDARFNGPVTVMIDSRTGG